jgi:hypothetical protein
MITLASSTRFGDVDEEADYAYHGTNHEVRGTRALYKVRFYDDEPGVAAVISPANARTLGEARELVDFLRADLAATAVKFYRGQAEGAPYAFVDLDSLEFK